MKKEVDSITRAIEKMVSRTKMDVIVTASSSDEGVNVEVTLTPKTPTKKAGF